MACVTLAVTAPNLKSTVIVVKSSAQWAAVSTYMPPDSSEPEQT
jgi:hypothetical protein